MNINMTQCNIVNVKLSNSQLNELISAANNATEVTLKLSSNMIGNSNDEANLENNLSANIRLSKTQLSETIQSGGFLGPLLKIGLQLMKNVFKPLVKSVLIPLELTAAVSAANTGIQKKIFGSGTITLVV